mmetsp:Transcript_22816/g.39403  ORF Transcript_22816/g.39403 Transcript_22816/m.39403 type:complete len:254 (-) Transcript_22816:1724-2485(-)
MRKNSRVLWYTLLNHALTSFSNCATSTAPIIAATETIIAGRDSAKLGEGLVLVCGSPLAGSVTTSTTRLVASAMPSPVSVENIVKAGKLRSRMCNEACCNTDSCAALRLFRLACVSLPYSPLRLPDEPTCAVCSAGEVKIKSDLLARYNRGTHSGRRDSRALQVVNEAGLPHWNISTTRSQASTQCSSHFSTWSSGTAATDRWYVGVSTAWRSSSRALGRCATTGLRLFLSLSMSPLDLSAHPPTTMQSLYFA